MGLVAAFFGLGLTDGEVPDATIPKGAKPGAHAEEAPKMDARGMAVGSGAALPWKRSKEAAPAPGGTGGGEGDGASLCTACPVSSVACGQTVQGALEAGDCDLGDGSFVDVWRLDLPAPQAVSLGLTATFDTCLFVADSQCNGAASNDDCGDGTLNSCLTLTLPAGTSFILANSYDAGVSGPYQLRVACGDPVNLCSDCLTGTISCGQKAQGTLAAGDCDLGDGSYVDVWRLDLAETSQVSVQLRSSAFDTYLLLDGGECLQPFLATNDDCGGTLDSCVDAYLEAGTCFIFANSLDPGQTGGYEIEVVSCACPLSETPDLPGPADGETRVPADVVLSWNGTSLPEPARAALQPKLVYGTDDRLEEYQVTDALLRAAGDSTAAVVSRSSLTENADGTYSLPGQTFAQEYEAGAGRSLCVDEPFRNQPSPAWCSAFLVAPDVMATAGHCVSSPSECADVAFVFGFVMLDGSTPVLRVDASQVYFCSGIVARQVADADWGLIRLDRRVEGHAPLALRRTGQIPDGQRVAAVGHPLGLPRKYAVGVDTNVRDNSGAGFFAANLDTYGGNSGSAVLHQVTLEVEGILVRGNTDFVDAGSCDRSNVCPDEGCPGWEDVTRIAACSWLLPVYDVYLGTTLESMARVAESVTVPWYDAGTLRQGTSYRWRIVSRNVCGTTEGPVWSFTTQGGLGFVRSDANADGSVDLSDPIATLGCLFLGTGCSTCLAAQDSNDDGTVDISDAVFTLGWLFLGSSGPAAPAPSVAGAYPVADCGSDPDGSPDCASFAPCSGA